MPLRRYRLAAPVAPFFKGSIVCAKTSERHPSACIVTAQVFFKPDRVLNMPAVHSKSLLTLIEPVRFDHLRQAQVWRGIGFVLTVRIAETPGATKVILGACAAYGREVSITIHIELDFALAPSAAIIAAPCHIGADIMAHAVDAIEDGIHLFIRKRIVAAPLRV